MRSDAALQRAEADLGAAQRIGLHVYIVLIAFLDWQEAGLSRSTAIERAISKIERIAAANRTSFPTTASFARAVMDYGMVGNTLLSDALSTLEPNDPKFEEKAFSLIKSVNAREAAKRRAGSVTALGKRAFVTVEEVAVVTAAADLGDATAFQNAVEILHHMQAWASGKRPKRKVNS